MCMSSQIIIVFLQLQGISRHIFFFDIWSRWTNVLILLVSLILILCIMLEVVRLTNSSEFNVLIFIEILVRLIQGYWVGIQRVIFDWLRLVILDKIGKLGILHDLFSLIRIIYIHTVWLLNCYWYCIDVLKFVTKLEIYDWVIVNKHFKLSKFDY